MKKLVATVEACYRRYSRIGTTPVQVKMDGRVKVILERRVEDDKLVKSIKLEMSLHLRLFELRIWLSLLTRLSSYLEWVKHVIMGL